MDQATRQQLRRRSLFGRAGALVALPWFRPPSANAEDGAKNTSPKRFVVIGSQYGQYPNAFFPSEEGENYELSEYLRPLASLKNHFTVMRGLDHGLGGGHKGVSAWLTGVRYQSGVGSRMYSVDQFVADRIGGETRFPSISLSLGSSESVSWNRRGVRLRSVGRPQDFFDLLFQEENSEQKKEQRRQFASDKSVLDTVMENAGSMRTTFSHGDRKKFDEYLHAVGEVERQLTRSDLWLDEPKPVATEFGITKAPTHEDLEAIGGERISIMRSMYDLMVLALQTDSTRVISLNIPGGNARFPIDGVNDGYHSLTHHGQDPEKIAQLKLVESYYVKELGRFLQRLRMIPDGNGTLLDSTVVLFGSGMGNASGHSNRSLPTLVAGGGFRHGQSLIYAPDQVPLSNLFVTILQHLGIEVDRFGRSTGRLLKFG